MGPVNTLLNPVLGMQGGRSCRTPPPRCRIGRLPCTFGRPPSSRPLFFKAKRLPGQSCVLQFKPFDSAESRTSHQLPSSLTPPTLSMFFAQFQAGPADLLLATAANLDILQALKDAWYEGITVVKIKSDQNPCGITSPASFWSVLGNRV